jgi:hypothetical protein
MTFAPTFGHVHHEPIHGSQRLGVLWPPHPMGWLRHPANRPTG